MPVLTEALCLLCLIWVCQCSATAPALDKPCPDTCSVFITLRSHTFMHSVVSACSSVSAALQCHCKQVMQPRLHAV